MTEQSKPVGKMIDRVRKLMALAADGGATEAEAQLAAEMARKLMAEHGLSTATIEASGGEGERRAEDAMRGLAGQWYQPPLMEAVCESCFVYVERVFSVDRGGRSVGSGYRLIGRESGVATARVLFEYLCQTIERMAREASGLTKPKWFRRGMSERLVERIKDRHQSAMEEQARAAREANARGRHPASTGNALVVVLEDYAQRERDLNEDMRRGVAPGTTARNREESVAREEAARLRTRELAEQHVRDLGVSWAVALYMAVGFSRSRAEELCAPDPEESESERRSRLDKEEKQSRRERERRERRWYAEERKRLSPEWRAGRRAADDVGLDQQVSDERARGKLTRE